eukprot:2166136-Rhodomonas_salina.1
MLGEGGSIGLSSGAGVLRGSRSLTRHSSHQAFLHTHVNPFCCALRPLLSTPRHPALGSSASAYPLSLSPRHAMQLTM